MVDVDDKQIMGLIKQTIDIENPRRFYQNIMDYGSWLKVNGVRNISNSRHYKKQSPLEGSIRQVRGWILRELASGDATVAKLRGKLPADNRFDSALDGLICDGLVSRSNDIIHLTK